jgi:hypothetical protein
MTTIATWNLHQMGRQVEIPDGVVDVIREVRPDVLVLTEYVDRGGREEFERALHEIGYTSGAVSPAGPAQNQVLIASVAEQMDGKFHAPGVDEAARTNFLHRWLPKQELNLIGFRVPSYLREDQDKLAAYWADLRIDALSVARVRTVFIGDLNWGRTQPNASAATAIESLQAAGYKLVPAEGGSDRALLSAAVRCHDAWHVEQAAGHRLTGEGGLSDHPMLVVEVV